MKKLWSGRFKNDTDFLMEKINSSIGVDKRLFREDIDGSIAHAEMLAACSIISPDEKAQITKGLEKIRSEIESGSMVFSDSAEDIHMAIETRLTGLIGDTGKKLHTARSRNDQVITDVRLYLKHALAQQMSDLKNLLTVFTDLAEKYQGVILPGYTHMQGAQPISLGFYYLAYFFMLHRDYQRFTDAMGRIDSCPLGSGALAGVNYPINRTMTAHSLGFSRVTENALDAVSDRDFIIEYTAAAALCMVHLSRINEEMIIWTNPEFSFIEIADEFSSGSSMMPNKKNPDACELIRGKTGRVCGALLALLTIMKGLPLSYNKDMQEDKEQLFNVTDTLDIALKIMPRLLLSLTVNETKMRAACENGFLQATELADYLVKKGVPFRTAHHHSGRIVGYCAENKKTLKDLSIEEYKKFAPEFESDVFPALELEQCIAAKKSSGSTSPDSVTQQILQARTILHAL